MTSAQLLNELRDNLEANAELAPAQSADRARLLHELEDRSLWSGRLRRVP
jgi:hypothetical protein